MIFDIEEAKKHCEWMLERGLGLSECANVLGDMECGDSFSLAINKVYKHREYQFEKIREKLFTTEWSSPLTP